MRGPTLGTVPPPRSTTDDRASLGDLALRVCFDVAGLLRDSLRLVSAEAQGRLSELGTVLLLVASAGAALIVSLGGVAAAMVAGLVALMPLWGAALLVAGLALALALWSAGVALRRLRTLARPPEQTLSVLEEGMQWIRLRSHS